MKTTRTNEQGRMNNAKWRSISLFTFIFSLFISFSSCGNDDNETPEVNDGRVKFFSGSVATPQQRIGGTDGDEWQTNDKVGIYMLDNTNWDVAENAKNIKYEAQPYSDPKSASFTGAPIYYPVNAPAKVKFLAYHPYTTSVADFVYPINLATQSPQTAIDLMVANATNGGTGYDKNHNQAVNLVFDHQLVKLVMNVSGGSEIGNLSTMAVKIEGMNNEAAFNLTSKQLSGEKTKTAIVPAKMGATDSYEAILLPVSALDGSHKVIFTVAGNDYEWTITSNSEGYNKLEKGKKYTFDVKLIKGLVVAEGTIKPWVSAGAASDVEVN